MNAKILKNVVDLLHSPLDLGKDLHKLHIDHRVQPTDSRNIEIRRVDTSNSDTTFCSLTTYRHTASFVHPLLLNNIFNEILSYSESTTKQLVIVVIFWIIKSLPPHT